MLASILYSLNFYLTFDIFYIFLIIFQKFHVCVCVCVCVCANSMFSPLFIMWCILGDYRSALVRKYTEDSREQSFGKLNQTTNRFQEQD